MAKLPEFKIGDRVRCISTHHGGLCSKVGTVKAKCTDDTYAVEFDDMRWGHDCDGYCKKGRGWWLSPNALAKIGSQDKIIIYAQDDIVTAKLLCDKSCIAQATAKCSPTDTFDVLVGAQVALQRLVDKQGAKHVVNLNAFHDTIELIK